MSGIDLGLVLWVLGVLISGVISALGWQKAARYRLMPITFGTVAGVLVVVLGVFEGRDVGTLVTNRSLV